MRYGRLQWICKVIEYERLTRLESNFLYDFVADFMTGKFTETSEEKLEALFAEVQWREVNKESVPIESSTPPPKGVEVMSSEVRA